MVAEQKRAWFNLGVFIVSLGAFLGMGLSLGWGGANGAFGLVCLVLFSYLFRRREKPDERDMSINTCALAIAGMATFVAFVLCCMGVWAVALWHHQEQISSSILCSITLAGGWVFYLTHSITVLILYSRHVEADNV